MGIGLLVTSLRDQLDSDLTLALLLLLDFSVGCFSILGLKG